MRRMALQVAYVPAPSTDLSANLEHYWKFDETSGSWADSVGSNPVVPAGTPVYSASGVIGHCLDTATGSGIGYATGLDLSGRSFTLAGWIQMYGTGTIGSINPILCQGDASTSTLDFYIMYRTDVGPEWIVQIGPTGASTITLPGTFSEAGTVWYFWCVRYDKDAAMLRLRINDVDATPVASPGIATHVSGSAPCAFGNFVYGAGYNAYARFDETGVWGRSLSDTECGTLFNSGAGYRPLSTLRNGLEHYWKLDEVGSAPRTDSIGSNALTVVGTPADGVGHIGGAFDANGASYLQGANIDISAKSFTIAGWLQAYGLDVSYNDRIILLSQGTNGSVDFTIGYAGSLAPSSFAIELGPTYLATGPYVGVAATPDLTGTVWVFLCVRYDLATQTMRFRMNSTDATPMTGVVRGNSGLPLLVGRLDYPSLDFKCRSRFDEIGIWGRPLSDSEVTQLYAGWTP
jgi:hypothetical protein